VFSVGDVVIVNELCTEKSIIGEIGRVLRKVENQEYEIMFTRIGADWQIEEKYLEHCKQKQRSFRTVVVG